MSTETDDLRLAADFAPASRDDWRKLVDGVLRGAPFEKLTGKTYDGLRIDPIYERARNAAVIPGRAPAAPWQIMQRVDHPDAATANAQALHDLENGATGLTLVFAGAKGAHGTGLEPTPAALARVLDGIYLDAGVGIEFQIGPQTRNMPAHFAALLQQKGISPSNVDVRFGRDPIGATAVWGNSPIHGRRSVRLLALGWPNLQLRDFADRSQPLTAASFTTPGDRGSGACLRACGGCDLFAFH